MTTDILKKELRTRMLSIRDALSEEEAKVAANQVFLRVIAQDAFKKAKSVFCYVARGTEMGTNELLNYCHENGKRIYLPRITGKRKMTPLPWKPGDTLEPNKMNILEPISEADGADIELAIVPGVGFDENRGRLGFGGGFYDTFFEAQKDMYRLAIAYDFQIVDSVPLGPHDMPMDVVTTPSRTI